MYVVWHETKCHNINQPVSVINKLNQISSTPSTTRLHTSLAYIYREMGEEEKAHQEILIIKSIYLQLIARYPKGADYHFSLAGVYKELDEYEKAYQEALLTLKLNAETKDEVEGFIHSLPGDYWQNYFKSTEQK